MGMIIQWQDGGKRGPEVWLGKGESIMDGYREIEAADLDMEGVADDTQGTNDALQVVQENGQKAEVTVICR